MKITRKMMKAFKLMNTDVHGRCKQSAGMKVSFCKHVSCYHCKYYLEYSEKSVF